jgi:hypothetical protein
MSASRTFAPFLVCATSNASYTIVPRLGRQLRRARSDRNFRATDVVSGFACIATMNPETIAEGLPSFAGPGGLKYGASWGRSGRSAAAVWIGPDSGRLAHPAVTSPDSARTTSRAGTRWALT